MLILQSPAREPSHGQFWCTEWFTWWSPPPAAGPILFLIPLVLSLLSSSSSIVSFCCCIKCSAMPRRSGSGEAAWLGEGRAAGWRQRGQGGGLPGDASALPGSGGGNDELPWALVPRRRRAPPGTRYECFFSFFLFFLIFRCKSFLKFFPQTFF